MRYKIFQIVCVLIFFLSFGYFFGHEYWSFHETETEKKIFEQQAYKQGQDFSLEEINEPSQEIELWETPSVELLKKLVREIDEANQEVLVEVYIFTERDLRDALIRAHKRWVQVQILLENNPYKATYLNDNHYESFMDAWVNVRWSDPLNYSLNHSKLLIIDNRAYVATWNFSYSSFTKNRDFFVEVVDSEIVDKLKELFILDFNHTQSWVFHPQLLVSPYSSRQKIEELLKSATKSIDFYFPYMTDRWLDEIFAQQRTEEVKIRWVVGQDYTDERWVELMNKAQSKNYILRTMKKPKLHAKAILVDEKYLYIGSINYSTYSLDENREVGIIISDTEVISKFQSIFESDFTFGKQ